MAKSFPDTIPEGFTRPAHLFVSSCDGDLHDTRRPDWRRHPLRQSYSYTFARIDTAAQLKATLRAGAYAWPGGYPLYFITSDGAALSFAAVRRELRQVLQAIADNDTLSGWRVCACDINWEDSELTCDHTGKRIESAYGED